MLGAITGLTSPPPASGETLARNRGEGILLASTENQRKNSDPVQKINQNCKNNTSFAKPCQEKIWQDFTQNF